MPRTARPYWFLLPAAVLLALLYVVAGIPLREARDAWRTGAYSRAIGALEQGARLRVRPADYHHLFAVTHLSLGRKDAASRHLRELADRKPDLFPVIDKDEVARALIAAGKYEEFLAYDSAVRERNDSVALERAAALLGVGKLAESDRVFGAIDEEEVDPKQYVALRHAIGERKRGSHPWIVDRNGKTLAAYHVDNRDVVTLNGDFAALIEKEAGPLTFETNVERLGTANAIETTLDPFIQKAAVYALGGHRGAIVAIDPDTNEIRALASTTGSSPANLALDTQYEPASTVKVLTALAAIDHRVGIEKMFPMTCEGFLVLNDRQFFDWARHDQLADLNEAMAVSCNVAFGRLGVAVGGDRMKKFAANAGFDQVVDLGAFRVPLGKTKMEIYTYEYSVATYAVGLEHLSINALHLAMIGAAVANGGTMSTPRLIRGRRSILGDPVPVSHAYESRRIASPAAVEQVKRALNEVVTSPRGTGRRAIVPGLSIAMKTGTAGQAVPGYDALVMGYAPANAPKLAVGIILEHAGPAEFAGAKVTADFFREIRDRL